MLQRKSINIFILILSACIPLQSTIAVSPLVNPLLNGAGQSTNWKLIGNKQSTAKLSASYDERLKTTIIHIDGMASLTGKGGIEGTLKNYRNSESAMSRQATWHMNMENDFQINFSVDTRLGRRQLSYTKSDLNPLHVTDHIFHFKIETQEDDWTQITRNLGHDLDTAEPGNSINAVRFAVIKGKGAITSINLKAKPASRAFARAVVPGSDSQPKELPENKITASTDQSTSVGTEPAIAAALPGGNRRSIRLISDPSPRLDLSIDGYLTEAEWHSAPVANDFRINDNRVRANDPTEVRVLADKKHLYFGFRLFDSRPNLIKAIKTLRDGGLGTDDAISVSIDTYRDYNTAATYSINAIGTQHDQLSGGSVDKIQWKGDWKGAAKKTDYGWSAEIAIPFDILKFNPKTEAFGINFSRYQHHTAQTSHWVKPSTAKQRDPLGLLSGLTLPTSQRKRTWTWMPYLVAASNTFDRDGDRQDQSLHGGLTARYEPTRNMTGLVEIFPDFSQVESQISDIDFSYNEKEVTDSRPFFQDGEAYFNTNSEYFYSPRIPDFNTGVKTYSNDGSNAVGAMLVNSPDGRSDMAARYRRQLAGNSGLTLTTTANRTDGELGYLVAAGFDKRFRSGIIFDINTARNTDRATDISGNSANVLLGFGRDEWEIGVKMDRYDVGFAPRTGLVNGDLPGTRATELYASWYDEKRGVLKQINTDASLIRRQTLDGEDQNEGLYLSTGFEVFGNTRLQVAYNSYRYRPVSDIPGTFSATVNDDSFWTANMDFNIYSDRVGYGAFLADGILGGGDYNYRSAYVWFNPTHNTNLQISIEDLESFGRFKQTTISAGWDISRTDGLVARYNAGEGYHQSRLAYRRKVSSGMDVFVSALKNSGSDPEITGKFVWTF